MSLHNYYFRIRDANVYECIKAVTWTEAKAIATEEWLPYWNQIEWLTPTAHDEVKLPNV
jgi:hypothetical protein